MGLRPLPVGSPGALGLTVRLLLPSLRLRVSESSSLSAWSFPFGVCHFFLRLFLCWRPCRSRSLIPSLAPSWWLPCPLLLWALLTLSGYVLSVPSAVFFASVSLFDPVALSPLLHRVFTDVFRHWCAFRFCGGGVSLAFGPVGTLGELRWLHLYRLTPDLIGLRHFAVCHWSSGRCFSFLLCDIPPVFMAIIWSVSLTPACPLRIIPIGGYSLDTCKASEWLDLLSSSSLFQDSVICADLWSRQLGSDATCDRHSVALSLSPSLTVVMTQCYCGTHGGLHVLVGSLPYPSPGRMFELSCFGRLQCLEAGLTSRPLLALP